MKIEKEQAVKKLNQLKKKQQEEIDGKIKEMKTSWKSFCSTFNLDKWEEAQGIWSKLDKEGVKLDML